MERTKIKDLVNIPPDNRKVLIEGWVRTRRDSKGGFSFIEINDGSTIKNFQVIADSSLPNYENEILKLTTGSSARIEGILIKSAGAGQLSELKAEKFFIYGYADDSFPLQKKGHTFEFLREIAHLRPRSNTFGAIGRIRHGISFAVHKFFNEKGFFYVHTPIITSSDCEGAGEMFKVTTLDLKNKKETADFSKDFFGKAAYLTVSGQLEGELYACSLGDVYTFGPTFRAENSNTPRHLAEFWMIEPEMAFCDLQSDIKTAVEFIKFLIQFALDNLADDIGFFNKFIDKTILVRLEHILKSEFKVITYTEAVSLLEKSGETWEFPVSWGANLQAEHEKYLTRQIFNSPVVVIDYPKSIKPFYMYVNDDDKTVRGMDMLVPKIGEIIGGSQREHRLDKLLARMTECGLNQDDYKWYIETRKYGTVPHSGFGLGFERFIQFITGMANIRDVIPFPRTPGNAKF
ncbi:MAG TPA: asparagine--tRNA ligase [bacterium]|mgnify:CR=1 FL=1|nr:asparagine--tRNA ligase [bacterium]HPN30707.1 asparagine--tRNA ligase [bacterium]